VHLVNDGPVTIPMRVVWRWSVFNRDCPLAPRLLSWARPVRRGHRRIS